MVDGGYTIIGDRAGDEFNNSWWYDIGLGQDLAGGVVNLSVFVEEYRALVPGIENAREALAAVSLRSASGWRVQFSGSVDRKSTRLNSSHSQISYAVFCLKKKK